MSATAASAKTTIFPHRTKPGYRLRIENSIVFHEILSNGNWMVWKRDRIPLSPMDASHLEPLFGLPAGLLDGGL